MAEDERAPSKSSSRLSGTQSNASKSEVHPGRGSAPEPVDPARKMEEKMDKDFLFFLSYIPVTYKNVKEEHEQQLCREWLKRLINKRPQTGPGKRNRNYYMVNLILQMGDGKLSPPFTSRPPQDKLKPARVYFGGIEAFQPCMEDLNFDIEDYSEFSKDGRSYFATKSLPKGRGAFAYMGISSGGGDTVWVDAAGNPVCPDLLNKTRESNKKFNEEEQILEKILSQRSPVPERTELLTFYEGLLNQVNEIIQNYGTPNEPSDPVIERMIEDLQMEALENGKMDSSTLNCYTRLHWLQNLQEKLEDQLNTATAREIELTKIQEEVSHRDEITFLDISDAIKSPKVDTMFDEAARDIPTQHNINLLKKHYPECVVQKLLMLLEKEKFNLISQERSVYQDFILQLKTEIMNVVRRGLEKYAVARKEWQRVVTVMRLVEDVKNKLHQDIARASMLSDPDFKEKEALLDEQVVKAKQKLEESKLRNDHLEDRLTALHEQIHNLSIEYEKMEEEAKRTNERFEHEICLLQKEIQEQERKIAFLKSSINKNVKGNTCRRITF